MALATLLELCPAQLRLSFGRVRKDGRRQLTLDVRLVKRSVLQSSQLSFSFGKEFSLTLLTRPCRQYVSRHQGSVDEIGWQRRFLGKRDGFDEKKEETS